MNMNILLQENLEDLYNSENDSPELIEFIKTMNEWKTGFRQDYVKRNIPGICLDHSINSSVLGTLVSRLIDITDMDTRQKTIILTSLISSGLSVSDERFFKCFYYLFASVLQELPKTETGEA